MMHRWIGGDECSTCIRCGLAVCDDADRDYLPPCSGPNTLRAHHYVAAPDDGIECAYGDAAIGPYTEWSDLDMECIGA